MFLKKLVNQDLALFVSIYIPVAIAAVVAIDTPLIAPLNTNLTASNIFLVFGTPKNLLTNPATPAAAASSKGVAINPPTTFPSAFIKAESILANVDIPIKRPPTATVNEEISAPLTICLAAS